MDASVTFRYARGVGIMGEASWAADGPALRTPGRLAGDMVRGYLMLDVVF